MELEQREGTMAAVGFEEFSAPPGSELALPPLFGGHILESELETEVEFVSGGLGGSGLRERDEEEEAARGRRRRQRELNRRKYQALGRRCREIEQVNERVLNRLHQVQRITRRLQQERRFLMKVLDSYGDDYRASQFTIVLEDEGSQGTDAPTPGNTENEPPDKEGLSPPGSTPVPPEPSSPAPGEGPSGRRRRRAPRDMRRPGAALTPEPPMQVGAGGSRTVEAGSPACGEGAIKVEEDFGFETDEALDSSWVSRGPDKLLPYPTLASPPFD
ncbi:TCF3 fusion partner homolog isoform X1 [Ochotona curzoniae]|uniref:TCF3 fusion partner isoform X1 n=1 Tax=Ochotona curzoniae TaxID=130825 RepID=UPI001B34BEC5|nr:TCF3 fusion partner isoform X1 [Ochotona curzoniae]XP_040852323.1 TCF3 fusion partner homolog isoform X1 [Ochotona curzoniae]